MRVRVAGAAAVASLLLATSACGGDDSSSNSSATTAAPATSAAAAATTAAGAASPTTAAAPTTAAGGAASGGSPLGGQGDGSGKGKTIQLAAVFSLTGAGGVYGPQQRNGVQLAVDLINANGGINGATVSIEVVDDASDKAQAAQQTQRMIQEKNALAIIGPTLSNSAVAAHPIAASAKVPMLAVSNTGLGIVGPQCTYCNGWIFRDSLGEASAFPANIKAYADAKHPKTAALLYPNDDKFSVDGATIVKDAAPSSGITLADPIEFTKAETDLSPYVTKAVQGKPHVIFITSLGGIAAKVMSEARKQGFTGQFLGGNGFNTAAVSKQAGADGKGAQSAAAWYIGNDFEANAAFVKAYKAKFSADPDQFAAQAFTGMEILADAMTRAKLGFADAGKDRQAIRDAMESTTIETPLGPFQFTSEHDVRQTIWIQAMDGQGGFTLVSSVAAS